MSETQVNNAVLDSITEWVSNTQNATKNANTINYTVPVDQTSKLYILPSTVLSNVPTLNMAFNASTTAAGSVGYWQPSSGTLLAVSCKGTRFSVQMGQVETGYVITNSTAVQAVQLRINVPVETGAGVGTGSATGSGVLIELLLTNDKCIALPLIGSTYNCFFNAEDTFPVYILNTGCSATMVNNVTFHTNVLTCNNARHALVQKQSSVKNRLLPIAVGIVLAALASSSIMRPSEASSSNDSLLKGQCPLSIYHNGILYNISTAYNATAEYEGNRHSRAKVDSVEPHLLDYQFKNYADENAVKAKLQELQELNEECYQPTFKNSVEKLEYELLQLQGHFKSDSVYVLVDENDQIQFCALLESTGNTFEWRAYSNNVKRFLQLKLDKSKLDKSETEIRKEIFDPDNTFVGTPLKKLYRLQPRLNRLTSSVQQPNSPEVVQIANEGPQLTKIEIANESPQLTEVVQIANESPQLTTVSQSRALKEAGFNL